MGTVVIGEWRRFYRADDKRSRRHELRGAGQVQPMRVSGEPATTLFSSAPSRSISTRTRSPILSQGCGLRARATPLEVPVKMTSPGSRVMTLERNSTWAKQSKTRFDVLEFWRRSPFTKQRMPRQWGSTSSPVVIQGPKGACVSKDFPMTHWLVRSCQSRTLTSSPAQ